MFTAECLALKLRGPAGFLHRQPLRKVVEESPLGGTDPERLREKII